LLTNETIMRKFPLFLFPRWCAEGGELILCDKCPSSFCKRCLQRNLGRKFVSEITSTEEWKCLACDPKQVMSTSNKTRHFKEGRQSVTRRDELLLLFKQFIQMQLEVKFCLTE
jgi:hypothetical protein